jgi:hypothetical protein
VRVVPSIPETLHTPLPLLESTLNTTAEPAPPADEVADSVDVPPMAPDPGPVKEMTWLPGPVLIESEPEVKEPEVLVAVRVNVEVPSVVGVP